MSFTLIDKLYQHAEASPEHPAVVTSELTISYAQLAQYVAAQSHVFAEKGITTDATIGIRCSDELHHLLICLAASAVGATSCTIPTHEDEDTQKLIEKGCKVTQVLDNADAWNLDDIHRPDVDWVSSSKISNREEARLLFATSGTTGEPKLVIHHSSDIVIQAPRHINAAPERFACVARIEHNFAKRHRLYCVAVGATNIFLSGKQDTLVEQCLALGVNVLHVSAFQAQELLATPNIKQLSNIRLKLGGSHAPLALRQQLQQNITPNLQAGYGTTETGAIGFTDPLDTESGDSVGKPLPGIHVRAVSAKRKPLPPGERGELAIRCDGMFRGYLGKENVTAERLVDGWFYTGDIGYLDDESRIHVCGRADDMFVFNSMNIFPQDIEAVVLQHPEVADAAVIPKPSSVHGNIPVALIQYKVNVKQRLPELEKSVKKQLGVRSPRQYIIVQKIPKTSAGKLARSEAVSVSKQSDDIRIGIIDGLNTATKKRLSKRKIRAFINGDIDIALKELDLDSLDRMELLVALEIAFDRVIAPHELGGCRYLGSLVSLVMSDPAPESELKLEVQPSEAGSVNSACPPKVVKLFWRICRFCPTNVHLNTALRSLEVRLTPPEFRQLLNWNQAGYLVPSGSNTNRIRTVASWLKRSEELLARSGKQTVEPYTTKRVAPSVFGFQGTAAVGKKTLVMCFPPSGGRDFTMPNAVWLQHFDAEKFDVLMVSDPFMEGYRRGIPHLGNDLFDVCQWLQSYVRLQNYSRVVTVGFSAGALPALTAGLLLKAELAISVGGRFYEKRHILKNLFMVRTLRRAAQEGDCLNVVYSYASENSRDKKYANYFQGITGGEIAPVELKQDRAVHFVLQQLLNQRELGAWLERSVFSLLAER